MLKQIQLSATGTGLWVLRGRRLLVSLLAAVFVWLTIVNQQDPMVVRTVADVPIPCPEVDVAELACDSITDSLTIRLRAPLSVWEELNSPIHQYLEVKMAPQNSDTEPDADGPLFQCRLDSRQGQLQVLEYRLASVRPGDPCLLAIPFAGVVSQTNIDPGNRTSQILSVSEERVGEVPDGFDLENLSLNVQYVTLAGPAELVQRAERAVAYIPLYSYVFNSQQRGFEMPVPIQIVDADGIVLAGLDVTPKSLVAALSYSPLPNTRQIRVLPDPAVRVASGYILAEMQSNPEFVILQGPETILNSVTEPLLVGITNLPESLTRTTQVTSTLVVPTGTTANVAEVTFTWEIDHVILNNTLRANAACMQENPDLAYDFATVFLHLRGPFEAFNLLYEKQAAGDFQWQVLYDCPQEVGTYSLNASRFIFQDEDVESSSLITMVSHDPPQLEVRVGHRPVQEPDS